MRYLLLKIMLFSFHYWVFSQSNSAYPKTETPSNEQERIEKPEQRNETNRGTTIEEQSVEYKVLSAKAQQEFTKSVKQFNRLYENELRNNLQKNFSNESKKKMQFELDRLNEINAFSFEANLNQYLLGQHDFSKIKYLNQATTFNANHPQVQIQWAAYHFIQKNEAALIPNLKSIEQSAYFNTELYWYAKDVLASLPKNAMLITHGYADTYPLLIQQFIYHFRKDVRIINLDFLTNEEMCKQLESLGWTLPKTKTIDANYLLNLVQKNNNKQSNLFIALSVPQAYLYNIATQGISGLTLCISANSQPRDTNIQFYRNNYLKTLPNGWTSSEGKRIKSNYLLSLISAYQTCDDCSPAEMEQLKSHIIDLATRTGKKSQVLTLIGD